jgi:nucleoid-associated protein YgaU
MKYTVVKGDNLWKIAKHRLGSSHRWKEIAALNHLKGVFAGSGPAVGFQPHLSIIGQSNS